MTRTGRWWVLGCAVLLTATSVTPLRAAENERGRELRRLLEQPVKFPGFDDPKSTFAEVLEALSKRYNLSFDINEHAFKEAARQEEKKAGDPKNKDASPLADVGKIEIATTPIPEMHTRLRTVLKKVLSRVSPSATYVIREDMIEITTVEAIRKEFFADRSNGPFPPLVVHSFDKVPLEAALKELAASGNVVLDSRAAKEAAVPVTADLNNVPLDTAVRMLADMAGLKVVPLDNVLYVTKPDNARALLDEQETLRLHRQAEKPAAPDPTKPKTPPEKK